MDVDGVPPAPLPLPRLFPASCSYVYGQTLVPEVEGGPRPTVHMLWTPVPQALTLGGEERERRWEFLTAVAESEEEAKGSYSEGLALAAAGSLHSSHARAWAALWQGCSVDLDGPLPLRQALRGCLYYLLSAIPPRGSPGFLFHGISPGGLSNGTRGEDYWGHVFWDQVGGGRASCSRGALHSMEKTPQEAAGSPLPQIGTPWHQPLDGEHPPAPVAPAAQTQPEPWRHSPGPSSSSKANGRSRSRLPGAAA